MLFDVRRICTRPVNHGFRIFSAFLGLLVLLCGWVWLADRFFDGPTTDFSVRYEHGVPALAEQFGAALYTPAWVVWEFAFSGWSARSQTLDRGPLFVLCILQLWPAFILPFRPWRLLSRTSRRVIVGYCALCTITVIGGFIVLHNSWERLFGP